MEFTVGRRGVMRSLALLLGVLTMAGGAMAASAQDPDRVVRAAHILVSPGDDPSGAMELDALDPAWDLARAEASLIAAELQVIADADERAGRFAELARTRSDDRGSGPQGGDLGPFTREVMVPEFADPIFEAIDLAPGDVLGPVRSEFGWHVILYQGEGELASPDPGIDAPSDRTALVEDAGAEPRTRLVYAPAEGSTATLTVTSATDSEVSIAGGAPLTTRQATTMTWDTRVVEVVDGMTRLELTLTDVSVDDVDGMGVTADLIRDQLEPMIGLSGWTVSDASGKVVDSGVETPDGLDPDLAQVFRQTMASFSQAPASFPIEPVGVGARWRSSAATAATDFAPGTQSEISTTLVAIDGSTVTTEATSVGAFASGSIAYPGLPAGSEVLVQGGSSTSFASVTMDLASLRMESHVTSESTLELAVDLDGRQLDMTTVTRVELTMRAE